MIDKQKIIEFLSTLNKSDISEDEIISQADKFVSENCESMDAEFINRLLKNKVTKEVDGLSIVEEYAYKGSGAAQLTMGAYKLEGDAKNISEAIFWLRRSYIAKNPNSGLLLASVYSNGKGVAENMAKAREYVRSSADLGVPKAQYLYACMVLEGEGGTVDEELAVQYMRMAAQNEYPEAIEFLEENGLTET